MAGFSARSGLAYYLKENPELFAVDVQPSLNRMPVAREPMLLTIMPSAKWVMTKVFASG